MYKQKEEYPKRIYCTEGYIEGQGFYDDKFIDAYYDEDENKLIECDNIEYVRADLMPTWININDRLPTWININDRLPTLTYKGRVSERVLVYLKNRQREIMCLVKHYDGTKMWFNSELGNIEIENVLAWMPIPKYKEERE